MAEVELPEPEELEALKEAGDKSFIRRVALTTAIYAVFLAITSLGGNNAMKEMILAQQQASDMWAFYQAKAVREHLYRSQIQRLEVDVLEKGTGLNPEVRTRLEGLLKKWGEEEKRYGAEKKDIEKDAKKLEHERDINLRKDPYFDYAEVLLQIAIVMATISIIANFPAIYYFSMVLAGLGGLLSVNGFLLLVRLPFFPG